MKTITVAVVALAMALPASAGRNGFDVDVLVGGVPRSELHARGTVYVEAIRGREYTIRVTNPLSCRVAVALAVDGLNTIDARHTDPGSAAKWVLDPYETIEIPGWQVSSSSARRFVFTGERGSYGAWLGATENLGVIEAVFYRERTLGRRIQPEMQGHHTGSTPREKVPPGVAAPGAFLDDDLAATGMGGRERHHVRRVGLELERKPAATVRIRYEFRSELVRLGVLPGGRAPVERRERAEGFAGTYCPEPGGFSR